MSLVYRCIEVLKSAAHQANLAGWRLYGAVVALSVGGLALAVPGVAGATETAEETEASSDVTSLAEGMGEKIIKYFFVFLIAITLAVIILWSIPKVWHKVKSFF